MTYRTALKTLSDPTRCRIFEKLRAGPQSVEILAADLPISRPAVSQHLKALKDAGLVQDKPEGTRRIYYIDPDGLAPLRRWLDQFWDDALDSFKQEVERTNPISGGKDHE
jgi:DNA-binding transcriptional ArsR family regulator